MSTTAHKQAQRARARASGLCPTCARNPQPKPLITCQDCRDRIKAAVKDLRRRLRA